MLVVNVAALGAAPASSACCCMLHYAAIDCLKFINAFCAPGSIFNANG